MNSIAKAILPIIVITSHIIAQSPIAQSISIKPHIITPSTKIPSLHNRKRHAEHHSNRGKIFVTEMVTSSTILSSEKQQERNRRHSNSDDDTPILSINDDNTIIGDSSSSENDNCLLLHNSNPDTFEELITNTSSLYKQNAAVQVVGCQSTNSQTSITRRIAPQAAKGMTRPTNGKKSNQTTQHHSTRLVSTTKNRDGRHITNDGHDDDDDKNKETQITTSTSSPQPKFKKLDIALALSYLCSIIAITTPIVLIPTISTSLTPPTTNTPTKNNLATTIASIATLGGAFGKIANGFVCQSIGGRTAARIYLLGLSLSSFLFSSATSVESVVLAATGMEFFNSIMWTVCTVTLASHYGGGGGGGDKKGFTNGMMLLSLASTVGSLVTKVGFSFLLKVMSWRMVARVGSGCAILGMVIVQLLVFDKKQPAVMAQQQQQQMGGVSGGGSSKNVRGGGATSAVAGLYGTLRTVLGCGLFWRVGMAHAMAFLARSSDKILGSFFSDTTNLPRYLCGGLTSSVTLGFIHGLITSRKFETLPTPQHKSTFLKTRYATAVVSALILALCATPSISRHVSSNVMALLVAFFSGAMASNVSFQFYHLPTTFAQNTFSDKEKAVCISFLDGMGFFIGWPIWALTGRLIGSDLLAAKLGMSGWSLAWLTIAGWFSLGGVVMMGAVPRIMRWEKRSGERRWWWEAGRGGRRRGEDVGCWVETV